MSLYSIILGPVRSSLGPCLGSLQKSSLVTDLLPLLVVTTQYLPWHLSGLLSSKSVLRLSRLSQPAYLVFAQQLQYLQPPCTLSAPHARNEELRHCFCSVIACPVWSTP